MLFQIFCAAMRRLGGQANGGAMDTGDQQGQLIPGRPAGSAGGQMSKRMGMNPNFTTNFSSMLLERPLFQLFINLSFFIYQNLCIRRSEKMLTFVQLSASTAPSAGGNATPSWIALCPAGKVASTISAARPQRTRKDVGIERKGEGLKKPKNSSADACGGLASTGQCTASAVALSSSAGCRDRLHCVSPGACCECRHGRPQTGVSDCRGGRGTLVRF
jgi:hypothetical protein